MGLLHQTENGEVPAVELTHERLHPWHHHGVQGQSRLVLPGAGKRCEMEVRIGDFPLVLVTAGKTLQSSFWPLPLETAGAGGERCPPPDSPGSRPCLRAAFCLPPLPPRSVQSRCCHCGWSHRCCRRCCHSPKMLRRAPLRRDHNTSDTSVETLTLPWLTVNILSSPRDRSPSLYLVWDSMRVSNHYYL